MSKTNSLKRLTMVGAMMAAMMAALPAMGQTNYVFYNSTYGYLYNDNGTLKSSTALQFDKSSVWTASGNLSSSSNTLRTLQTYNDGLYLGPAGALGTTPYENWKYNNNTNYLEYRQPGYYGGGTNYYLKATNATTYTTNSNSNSGNRYNFYTVTADDIVEGLSGVEITGSVNSFNAAGSATYSHSNATYCDQAYTHYNFNGNNYYVNSSNVSRTTNPATTITAASAYSWSLSDNATGYATVNASTGAVTVTAIPDQRTIITLICTCTYNNMTSTSSFYITLQLTGVSSGTVTLDDREDHTWTYYSGVDASVDGGNYNTNYVGKLFSPNPRNVKITYNGVNDIANSTTTVKVSVDAGETQNQFIYYKTLEESATSGEYPYQVISNPFSVRPSTGTGNSKVYYGFAGWKIVSGGEYIKNHSNGDVLALDEEIVFNNLPYPSVNCTSAEIVFQTTWTQANVQSGTNIATMLGNFTGGTYETNFAVLRATYTTAWTGNKNATITSVMPDGSSDYRGVVARLNVTVNAGYTIKYEYININNDGTTLSMGTGTKTLYIGRGVSNTNATGVVCGTIQGYDGSINSGGLTYTLKIESGIYNYLSYIKGYEGSGTSNTVTGTVSVKGVLGCDYDRAKNDNTKLKIQQQIIMGYGTSSSTALLQSATAGQEVLNVTFKSGSLHSSRADAGTADASEGFYIGVGNSYCRGYRVFTMEGGEMWSLAAGLCNNTQTTNSIRFRIKGGLIKGSIYGSAANANSYGYKQMILTGGTVRGWIAGGGNGTSDNGGTTTGSSYIYVGGNCRVDSEGSNTKINSSVGGQVFGSGSGVDGSTTWGEMLYGSNVVIADNAYVERNVFGGGNFGWTDQYANIYLTGDKMSVGKVFGGANQNKGDNVRIYMTGGTVREGLYGGSNTTGTINYNVEMHINGGQVGTSSRPANIHGGGYGQPTRVSQNVDITLGKAGQTEPGVTVYGDVYGGSALGYVNGTSANTTYHTNVTLNAGTINGSVYGGGLGDGSNAANVYSPVTVTVNGGSVKKTSADGSGGVYGANNINGAPQRAVTVTINGTDPAPSANDYALYSVYGGGNQADYTYGNGYPTVTVNNCDNSIEYVYGGGNAAAVAATDVTIYGGNTIGNVFGGGNGTVSPANVTGNTLTKIYGGTIGRVFGGSNSQGSIGGTIKVRVNKTGSCLMKIGELYGGGNMADSKVGSIDIGCTGDYVSGNSGHAHCNETDNRIGYELEGIGDVYGGANSAVVTGSVTLTIDSGMVYRVFGNNNADDSVTGTITVNIDKKDDACGWYVGYVYGGGNQAPYSVPNESDKYPAVYIKNGLVSYHVFGGGLGSTAKVTGNPTVTLDGTAEVGGNVYGGGNAAAVKGNTKVTLRD